VTRRPWHGGVYESTAHLAVVLLLLILFLATGYFFFVPDSEVTPDRQSLLLEIDESRAAWEATKPAEFTYVIRRSCFCPRRITRPFRVSESSGIVRATVPETSPIGSESDLVELPDTLSIDSVFELLADAVREADRINIAYDETFGFPTEIRIDWSARTIDDEDTYRIDQFVVIRQ